MIERELVWQDRFSLDGSTKVRGRFDKLYLNEALDYLGLTLRLGNRPIVCEVFDKPLKHIAQFLDLWFSPWAETPRWRLDQNIETETQARRLMADTIRA